MLREDTHKKVFIFNGRTNKRVGGNCKNLFQTILRLKKKWHGPTTNKNTSLCLSSLMKWLKNVNWSRSKGTLILVKVVAASTL